MNYGIRENLLFPFLSPVLPLPRSLFPHWRPHTSKTRTFSFLSPSLSLSPYSPSSLPTAESPSLLHLFSTAAIIPFFSSLFFQPANSNPLFSSCFSATRVNSSSFPLPVVAAADFSFPPLHQFQPPISSHRSQPALAKATSEEGNPYSSNHFLFISSKQDQSSIHFLSSRQQQVLILLARFNWFKCLVWIKHLCYFVRRRKDTLY